MTNYEQQQLWLNADVTEESFAIDLDLIQSHLISIERFISTSIGVNPLEFSRLLNNKLKKIEPFCVNQETLIIIKTCEQNLQTYKTLIENHIDDAINVAEQIEAAHNQTINEENIRNVINPRFYSLEDYNSATVLFNKSLTCYLDIFKELSPKLNKEIPSGISILVDKYRDNGMFTKLFLNDEEFLQTIKKDGYPNGSEVGHLYLQRTIYLSKHSTNKPIKATTCLENFFTIFINEFFKYDREAFKTEIVKLFLYKQLSESPVAWIGSSNTLMNLLLTGKKAQTEEVKGIYLNCDDAKWSSELNRAWLISLIYLGYDIKLVERQFPNVCDAILSNTLPKGGSFLIKLLEETRKLITSQEDGTDTKKNHSQYYGGDSPTATYLETLLILAMNYMAKENHIEGNIMLCSPTRAYIKTPGTPTKSTLPESKNITPILYSKKHISSPNDKAKSTPTTPQRGKRVTGNSINNPNSSSSKEARSSLYTPVLTIHTPERSRSPLSVIFNNTPPSSPMVNRNLLSWL